MSTGAAQWQGYLPAHLAVSTASKSYAVSADSVPGSWTARADSIILQQHQASSGFGGGGGGDGGERLGGGSGGGGSRGGRGRAVGEGKDWTPEPRALDLPGRNLREAVEPSSVASIQSLSALSSGDVECAQYSETAPYEQRSPTDEWAVRCLVPTPQTMARFEFLFEDMLGVSRRAGRSDTSTEAASACRA